MGGSVPGRDRPARRRAQSSTSRDGGSCLDRFSNLLYCNAFAEKLFGRPGKSSRDASVLSLGIMEKDHAQAIELAKHVLKGGVWEGTV